MAKIHPSKGVTISEKAVHMMSLHELQQKFNVDIKKGLNSSQVKELLAKYGKINRMKLSYLSFLKSIAYGLADYFSIVLWLSLVLFVLLYKPLDGAATNLINAALILLTLVVKSLFIGLQQFKLIRAMEIFKFLNANQVSVLRDSIWRKIPATNLVIGDVVEISANQRLPVDLRLFLVENLRLDKSIITGKGL